MREEHVSMNIDLSSEDWKFLKVYAAERKTTVASDTIKGHSTQGSSYFTYNGKKVCDIAAETQWKGL